MIEFEVTYGINCRRFIRHTIEAETPEEAERMAREQARARIDAECLILDNNAGWASGDTLEATMFVDACDTSLDLDAIERELTELDEA